MFPAVGSPEIDQIVLKYKNAALHTSYEKGIVISFIVSMLWEDPLFYKAVGNYALAADSRIGEAIREVVDGSRTIPIN